MLVKMDNQENCAADPVNQKSHMLRSSSLASLKKFKSKINGLKDRSRIHQPTLGEELEVVELDRIIKTEPGDNKNRRTIILKRQGGSWGFTLQSYGVQNRQSGDTEILTYVDYVDLSGPAHHAGMRSGDVILSINGVSMETATHASVVSYIKACGDTMRMVVLFEDCVQKVELHLRYLRLRRVLMEKMFELRALENQESKILAGKNRDNSRLSMADGMDFMYDTLSLKPELEEASSPCSTSSASSTSSGSSVFFSSRNAYEHRSLPPGARQRPQSLPINHTLLPEGLSVLGLRDKRPLSCIVESKSEETNLNDTGLKRRPLNSSVSGEISFVRDRAAPNPFPLLPPHFPLASPENPLRNTPFTAGGDTYQLPPPRRSSMRRTSRRYSFKDRRAHGVQCRSACPHNKLCSDHVITEDNSRCESDPQLLWLKHFESNPTVKLRTFSENSFLRTPEVHRKIISSASLSVLNNGRQTEGLNADCNTEDDCDNNCDMTVETRAEARWAEIESLSHTFSEASVADDDDDDDDPVPPPSAASTLNESLNGDVLEEQHPETYGAKFSFAQFNDTPCDSSTPHKASSEKRWKSKVRSQETPTNGLAEPADTHTDDGVELAAPIHGRQLSYLNETEETTKM